METQLRKIEERASVLLLEMIVPGCIITLLDQKASVGIVLIILNERVSDKDRLSGTLQNTAVSLTVCQRQTLDMLLGIR